VKGKSKVIRKRDRWTRDRDKGRRPRTEAPKDGWLLADLAKLAAVPISTLRYYLRRHVLRPIQFRGTATRYSRRELLMVLNLRQLDNEKESSLTEKRRRLDALSEEALESLVRSFPIPTDAAGALGLNTARMIVGPSRTTESFADVDASEPTDPLASVGRSWVARASASASPSSTAGPLVRAAASRMNALEHGVIETWQRIALLPGLDLMLHVDAQPIALAAAQRILCDYSRMDGR
jgi:DNA-binding transcriptional MerR regulator